MPLDITLFRADAGGNPDLIKESQRRRFQSVEIVDEIIKNDSQWRFLTGTIDNLRKERNLVQKEVATKKKAKEECEDLVARIKTIGDEITDAEQQQKQLKAEVDRMINTIGNIVADGVPISQDEDKDNLVVRKWGTPRDPKGLLSHHELLWRIGGYEPERGANIAGHRGYFLKDMGVMLNQAFLNYGIAFLRQRNYSVLQPPFMMKKDMMAGVAQLEQFDEELYKVSGGSDGEDKYLIATSEQPICGYHAGEWLEEKSLPLRYSGISTCFRKEAGKHGKDTWGIFRVHQFEKVEQFAIVDSDLETSDKMQEEMIATAEEFYQSLGFPYHVINIVSGALNNAAIRKYDLECWFPGYNAYRELVSCSNCTDYQSRPMEIRCGMKKLGDREKRYVHMLNATLCATGRAICCLLETYQESDGVRVPDVLIPFMGGITFMPFIRDAKVFKDHHDKEKVVVKQPIATTTTTTVVAPTPEASSSSVEQITDKLDSITLPPPPTTTTTTIDSKPTPTKPIKSTTTATVTKSDGKVEKKKSVEKKGSEVEVKKGDVDVEVGKKIDDVSQPPAVPILPPLYTTPAPSTKKSTQLVSASTLPTLEDIKSLLLVLKEEGKEGEVTNKLLVVIESRLMYYSYVAGFQPSALDNAVYEVVSTVVVSDSYVNSARWKRSLESYSTVEREAWV